MYEIYIDSAAAVLTRWGLLRLAPITIVLLNHLHHPCISLYKFMSQMSACAQACPHDVVHLTR